MSLRTAGVLTGVLASLALVACSTPGDGSGPDATTAGDVIPDDPPPTTDDDAESTTTESTTTASHAAADTAGGQLVAIGAGYILTHDLGDGSSWQQRLRYSAPWSTVTVVEEERELLIAKTSGAEPVVVTTYDLETFGRGEAFEWPDSTMVSSLHSLAATTDGDVLALVMEPLSNPYLEIVERSTGRIIYTGLEIATGATMTWTADDQLVVPIDLSYENDSERWGAIAAFPLEAFESATDADVDGHLITTFTRAEWATSGVADLALSPDDSELVFELAGDLWVVPLEQGSAPHQLTTGPTYLSGAAFAPDGDHLAHVSGGIRGLRATYVIDNHRSTPLFLDEGQGAGAEFLLESQTLVESVVAWLP